MKKEALLERKVKKIIEHFGFFESSEKILVALSGGKDSAVIAYVLKKLGYEFSCLHVNVGIGSFSQISEFYAKKQSEMVGCKLHVLDVKKLLGNSVEKVSSSRPVCSVCGITRRYLLNYFAFKKGFDVLVTGHNLDDIASFYLNNLLHGQLQYISSLKPLLPAEGNLVKRVKPLFFVREDLVKKYASINGIEFTPIECPHQKTASTRKYRVLLDVFDLIERNSVYNFVKRLSSLIEYKKVERKPCKVCGVLSSSEICSFCRIWKLESPLKV